VRNKLIIIGNYDVTRNLYDQSRTDGDVWAFNEMWGRREWLTRCDAILQLHEEAIWRNPANRTDPNHAMWLYTQQEIPVYMQEAFPDVPMAVKYPLEAIIDEYLEPYINKVPFGSTPGYALALGLYLGYTDIECYGIELGTETEYGTQRPEFAFWCGVAAGRGVTLTLHTDKLLNGPMYGYEGEWSIPLADFTARVQELTPPTAQTLQTYNDTHDEVYKRIDVFAKYPNPDTYNKLAEGINTLNAKAVDFGLIDGARQENLRYLQRAQAMIEASGKYIFSRQELESAKYSLMEEHKKSSLRAQDRASKCTWLIQSIVADTSAGNMTEKMSLVPIVIENYVKANTNTALLAGAIAENITYLDRINAGIQALGGEKALNAVLDLARGTA
jgi:hypothetical protein